VSLCIRNQHELNRLPLQPHPACLQHTAAHVVCRAPGHWIAACTPASHFSHRSLLGTAPVHTTAPCLFAGSVAGQPLMHTTSVTGHTTTGSPSHPRRACQVRRRGLYGVRWAAQRRHLRSMEPGQRVHAVRGLCSPCVTITARQWHYFISLAMHVDASRSWPTQDLPERLKPTRRCARSRIRPLSS
jgi:hypothetical protein